MSAPALPPLLAPEEFVKHLHADGVLVVDLSQGQVHRQAHVPGAVHVDFRLTQNGAMPAPGNLPSEAALSELLSSIGLTPDTHVVAYDDEGGGWAGR